MRLGAPIPSGYTSPEEWVAVIQQRGYRAAYCPVGLDADETMVSAYAKAAADADIVIAEVGAWSNPLSPDPTIRDAAVERCIRSLELAEQIGAGCCVNIAGSRGTRWDGPHPADLTEETFEMIVALAQRIIDTVKPIRTRYTLEPMPWIYPDSPDSYLRLIKAIDRPAFAVHFDPVNMINSPQRYFQNAAFIRECIAKLGHLMVSCHAKDILMQEQLTVHLDEVRPGLGTLDYPALLHELDRLNPDLPLMLEHLPSQDEYDAAAAHVRKVAQQEGIRL